MSLSRVELGFFSVALWPALREIPRGLQAQEVSWLSSGQGGLGAGSVEEQRCLSAGWAVPSGTG